MSISPEYKDKSYDICNLQPSVCSFLAAVLCHDGRLFCSVSSGAAIHIRYNVDNLQMAALACPVSLAVVTCMCVCQVVGPHQRSVHT